MKITVIYLLTVLWEVSCISPSIPVHLQPCYGGRARDVWVPRRLDVLLNMLRQLENNSQLNLRTFSTTVLRRFRLDGIDRAENVTESEFVIPYRASGFQFNKYELLMERFLPGQGHLDVDVLTVDEQCALHRMLSSAVARWERGDENRVCPLSEEQRLIQPTVVLNGTRSASRCPIEEGVIQTDWGTIAPGTVIAGIAAAMESQNVTMPNVLDGPPLRSSLAEPLGDDTEITLDIETLRNPLQTQLQTDAGSINNIYVATLSGDLAEVSVNQGPRVGPYPQRMTIGSFNKWNNTFLPRSYYMFVQDQNVINWHYTDAEILAGIDGFILAKYIPNWVAQRATLRLSQILDMYYSNEGVSFNPEVRACNRTQLFNDVFNNDTDTLYEELSNFVQLLLMSQGSVAIPRAAWDNINRAAVDAFMIYIPKVLSKNAVACRAAEDMHHLNIIVATDGAWTGYEVEQFMSWLGGSISMGWRSTSLALVHGNTGNWLVPPARNLTAFFSSLHNATFDWPNRLNFPNVLSTLMSHLQNVTLSEAADELSVALNTVVLIVNPGGRPSDAELERARIQMNTLMQSYFDVYFAYVGRDLAGYKTVNQYQSSYEYFLQMETTTVQEAIRAIRTHVIKSQIPKRIIGPHCEFNGTRFTQRPYEDFLLPHRTNTYRINPFYLKEQPVIGVQFRGTSTGAVMVCERRGEEAESALSCHEVVPHTYYWFNVTSPCPSADLCPPVYFSVSGITTLNVCANNDCRTTNEINYFIELSGLRCLPLRNKEVNYKPSMKIIIILIVYSLMLI